MANRPDKTSIDTTAIRAIRERERQRERERESSKQKNMCKNKIKTKKYREKIRTNRMWCTCESKIFRKITYV